MAINTSIYGDSNQWSNAFFQQAQIEDKNKLAYFGENAKTLLQGVANNKLSYSEPIDKSLSYCGLGTESAMSHVVYCGLHDNAFQAYDSTDRQVTNFAFFEKQTSTSYLSQENIWLNQLNRIDWSENIDTVWNYTKDLIPYTVINPHNILLYVSLSVSNGDGTYQYTSLNYFRNNYQQQNWSRIARVRLTPYFGNNFDGVAWSSSAGYTPTPTGHSMHLGLLDEYVVSTKNKRFYMYENPSFDWIPFGFVGANSISSLTDTNLVYMCYIPESAKSHIKYDNVHREFYIEYYDDIVEDILKTVACFGLYFCTTTADLGNLTNEYTYIGLLDEDGVGRGRYLQGADTVNAPQAQSGFKDMHVIPYDYKAVDNSKYSNGTQFNTNLSLGAFTKFYQLTESQVNDLCTALYTAVNAQPTGTPIEEYNMKCFLTNNPIDCIISLKKFPLNQFPSVGVPSDIYLGTVDTGIDAPLVLSTTWVYYFDFSNSNNTGLFPVFGDDFRDKEPYTTVQINVPFCGSFEVPTTYFYKYGGVTIALMIDFVSGACTAYLMVNGNVVDSVSGSCAVDLPVSGLQSATLDGNIHRAAMAEKSVQTSGTLSMIAGAISIGAGIVTANPLLAIGGATALVGGATSLEKNQVQIDYDVQHMNLPIKQVGAASGSIAQCNDYRCKMVIKRPVMLNYDNEIYAKTIGFACLINGHVSDFTGLTQGTIRVDNIINSSGMSPTDTEKQMIYNAFATGIIL